MNWQAKWICASENTGDVCPVFRKVWRLEKPLRRAKLYLTALGVYEARLNGRRVGGFVLAPGWTAYRKRLQYQVYDVTALMEAESELTVTVGKGWFSSPMPGWMDSEDKRRRTAQPNGILGELHLHYEDGGEEVIPTGADWSWSESPVRFSEIYDGEHYDARVTPGSWRPCAVLDWPMDILIPQEGEEVREQARIRAKRVFRTPAGELTVDFGQEVTGYVEFSVEAAAGDEVVLQHGEMLDREGNFYRDNYRGAKAELRYICRDGAQVWHPSLTFFGFRYVKILSFPGVPEASQFTAVALHSELRRTGYISCGVPEVNRLFSNILWGQRGNFLDVPTDCPQRDERLGWTGDAQVFVKAAGYNYDVEKFFRKWLRDLSADQRPDGGVGQVIPDYLPGEPPSAGWGDAAVICPWQLYQTYGNPAVLREQFGSMRRWVDFITSATTTPDLWTGGQHFGDWLGLDAPSGSYKGSSREDFIASAFYACSTGLLVEAGHVLGEDVSGYERLHGRIVRAFREAYPDCRTQTECVITLRFGLAEEPQRTADQLAGLVRDCGTQLKTGFIGTPYILHVLSEYGYGELAWSLLLRRAYPSWLYAVEKGATTVWEHWDGVMENGTFWSADMNSFNHYAYGSVADWLYERAAGIRPAQPGFASAVVAPEPDRRLGWLEVSLETRHGSISSKWYCQEDGVRYEVCVDMDAVIVIDGAEITVGPGTYLFWGKKR